jgi:predicted HTH transcriptional regulator
MLKLSQFDVSKSNVFPYPEGKHLEYKEGFACPFQKILETICAFMNVGGGHLIYGIQDDTLIIQGIKKSKDMDKVLLSVDNIYRDDLIQGIDNSKIQMDFITVTLLPTRNNKKLLILTVNPPPPNSVYKLKDGTIVYRLLASNYKKINKKILYEEDILEKRLHKQKEDILKEHEREYKMLEYKYESTFKKLKEVQGRYRILKNTEKKSDKEFDELMGASKYIESELEKHKELLYNSILTQKKSMERQLTKQKEGWISYLVSKVYCK